MFLRSLTAHQRGQASARVVLLSFWPFDYRLGLGRASEWQNQSGWPRDDEYGSSMPRFGQELEFNNLGPLLPEAIQR